VKKVLIIEDDTNLIDLVSIHLNDLECQIESAIDGQTGFDKAMAANYDLIILDVMLPKMDGIAVCQKLRALENYTAILMLTAKNEEIDKVLGLESGADDYLTKPFGIREFIARVKAIFRRQEQNLKTSAIENKDILVFNGLTIDVSKRKVELDGTRIDLTPKEFDLLALMANHPGKSYNRDELLKLIWGYEFSGYEHTVNSHINRLRGKLESNPDKPKYIITAWGIGYRFNDEL
jgi:two-component system, OmpR family, alkaline phosphatase synthesis response regulator PhoP